MSLAVIVYGFIWFWSDRTRLPGEIPRHLGSINWFEQPYLLLVLGGAFIGYMAIGSTVGTRGAQNVLGTAGYLFRLIVGAYLGAMAGAIVYLALWVSGNPEAPLSAGFWNLVIQLEERGEAVSPFLFAGALAGLSVTALLVSGKMIRRSMQTITGVVIGSLAGLVVFSVAYVLINYPGMPSADYVFHFSEAIYSGSAVEFVLMGMGAMVGVFLAQYSWRMYGILTLVSLLCVVTGYILFTVTHTLSEVPEGQRIFSYVLFTAEMCTLLLVLVYSFYTIDVAARKEWRRMPRDAAFSGFYLPKVAIHVPIYNEPPEISLETLRTLVALDYPPDRYTIAVLDDSTQPERSTPVEEFCKQNAIEYHHRDHRTGYKAGALNLALRHTAEDATLIAVVDSDYQVEPEFLRETVGYFIDPGLGWLQTPQDYRNRHESFLTEQYYLADAYFYRTILPSRNEENSIIFCGTMGILRKQALVDVGGWGEDYITEDAELSLRLINAGWGSLYVNKTFGRGLIPATFEAYKGQHYRWAAGGGKIVRGHILDLLFGRFTARQRFDFFMGNINWFEGAFIFLIALAVLFMGVAEILGLPFTTHHESEILLLGLVPWFLMVDGLTRIHMVLRRSVSLSAAGTIRVLGMWFSVKFSNMRGAIRGLLGFKTAFVRTKKKALDRMTRWDALTHSLRLTRFESTFAFLLVATSVGLILKTFAFSDGSGGTTLTGILLTLWLLYYSLVFLAAPFYAYKSYATLRPRPGAIPIPTPIGSVQT